MSFRKSAWMACCAGLAVSLTAMAQDKPVQPPQPGIQPAPVAVPSGPQPKITFAATTHNFGVIDDDKNVDTEFKFTNTGSAALEITNMQGSCGCTVPALEKKIYQPGEGGTIKVSYNPHNRRGKQHTNVTVTTNDPVSVTTKLDIESEVKPMVTVDPIMVTLGQVPKGKGTTQTVTITSRKKDLLPTQATPSVPTVMAQLGEAANAKDGEDEVVKVPLLVSVLPTAEVGQLSGQITVRTSDPARLLNVTVTGEIVGDVDIKPNRVQLAAVTAGQTVENTIRLTSRTGAKFKVLKVEEAPVGPKIFAVELTEEPDAVPPAWVINLKGSAPEAGGAFRGDLVVTTDVPNEATLKIPYFGFTRTAPKPVNPWEANPSLLVPR